MYKVKRADQTKNQIFSYLKVGLLKKDAARLAGIDESTFYRWQEKDASFASQVEANILEYKRSLIQSLNNSVVRNGGLALEILSRRWPKEWGQKKLGYKLNKDSDIEIKKLADIMEKIYLEEHYQSTI